MNTLSRNRVFELLGATPTNPRWSWCALSADGKRALFTLWDDIFVNDCQITPDVEAIRRRPGAREQQGLLEKVIKEKIPSFGIMCTAHDPKKEPRRIKKVNSEFLIKLRFKKKGDDIFAYRTGKVYILELAKGKWIFSQDGLCDIDSPPEGNIVPDRAVLAGTVVIRDPRVRAYVLKQANGKCEHCSSLGFLMENGKHYIEAHHIIALSKEGRDTVDNVIAVCPEHHREAHFGKKAVALEKKFQESIKSRKKKRRRGLEDDM